MFFACSARDVFDAIVQSMCSARDVRRADNPMVSQGAKPRINLIPRLYHQIASQLQHLQYAKGKHPGGQRTLPFPHENGTAGTRRIATNSSEEQFFTCLSELMCYVGTRTVVPGACIQRHVGWKVVKDFVKSCIAVVKKAKKILEFG